MADQVLLAVSTFPDVETANRIAEALVAGKLAACANLMPAVHSIYHWKEKIESAGEVMVFFKTTQDRLAAFEGKLRSLHPYEVPDRKSTRLNSSHSQISYAVFCLKKKTH